MTEINAQPIAPVQPVTDNYFGIDIVDNYRYMENFNDPVVLQWVKAQAEHTNETLANLPERDSFFNRMVELDASVPVRVFGLMRLVNGKVFYLKIETQDDVARLCMRHSINGPEILLSDPNRFRQGTGKIFTIHDFKPSWDGKYVIYLISANGSEDASLYVINTEMLQNVDEPISRVTSLTEGICWLPDSQSFFYHRLQELREGMEAIEKYQKSQSYLHRLGTNIEQDKLVLEHGRGPLASMPPTVWPYIPTISNAKYAIALFGYGTQKEIDLYVSKIASLNREEPDWIKICDVDDKILQFTAHEEYIYLLTSKNASHFKVIKTSLSKPNLSEAELVLAESDLIIRDLFAACDALYVLVTDNGIGQVLRIGYDGQTRKLRLPLNGTVEFLRNDPNEDGVLLSILSWTKSDLDYKYEPKTDQFTEIVLQPKGEYDALDDLVSEEVIVKSYDGTMVPLSIIHKKGIRLDGSNPCLLVGYGSYGYSYDPFYQHSQYAWYEQGGIWAIAHVRGGGENGEEWYRGGFQETKPNTWKDFIACAEYLIEQQYTSSAKLAGEGGSAGSILIGRAITERPDLFAVAIPRVGVLNPVRFETTPNGPNNISEFGSCATQAGFQALFAMDAFLHVREAIDYPAMLITHGINDPRVEPWQSTKFAARIQAASTSNKPILLRIDYDAGHGIGSTKTQQLQQRADIFAFMMWQFAQEGHQPKQVQT
jgi:prolyl oligopeptidase